MTKQHIADQYLDAWNRHDAQGILDCFHKDGVYIDANLDQEIPAEQFARRAQELFDCFPNLKISVDQRTAPSNGLVATPWSIYGAVPDKTLSGVDMLCIRENKLQSVQVYFDLPTGRLFAKVPSLHLSYRPQTNTSEPDAKNTSRTVSKYLNSGLGEEDMLTIKHQLETTLSEQRLYLNSELTLASLSQELELSTNHLSQVINSLFMMNYYDFINHYRIHHAKQLIKNDASGKLTSLVISLESGFKSTSTFYSAFKKETGLTPTDYRESLLTHSMS